MHAVDIGCELSNFNSVLEVSSCQEEGQGSIPGPGHVSLCYCLIISPKIDKVNEI